MQITLSTRLPLDVAQRLEAHAKHTGISKAAIVAAALDEYLHKIEIDTYGEEGETKR
jgi:predicted DNA-binding protein